MRVKKVGIIFLKVGIFFLILFSILAIIGFFVVRQFIYGTKTVLKGSGGYSQFTAESVHSPLVVFPNKDEDCILEDFYYEFRDEIFSPVSQIYLKKQYNTNQFQKEIDRLDATQLTYLGQTNSLYFDSDNFSYDAYVALADWSDRYEYALIDKNTNTIIYIYLENMSHNLLYIDETYLPSYFHDNNTSNSTNENISDQHRSFYAFKIGNHFIECMDLVSQ